MNKFSLIILSLPFAILNACGDTSDTTTSANTTPTTSEVLYKNDSAFTSTHFSGSSNCAFCHDDIVDVNNNSHSIVKDWQASMMANSAKDPLWLAKFSSELKRTPSLSAEINDKCTLCHTPMASIESKKDSIAPKVLDDGFLNANNTYHNAAMDGVSCSFCHQIQNTVDFGTDAGMSGQYKIESFTNKVDRKIYGKYPSPNVRPMQNNVAFTPTESIHISSSELCATCHNLKTPFVDTNENLVVGQTFPEQMVYSEWQHSDFDDNGATPASCQQCHMPKKTVDTVIANKPKSIPARSNFSKHVFLGANTFMQQVLKNNAREFGLENVDFDTSIVANRNFLKTSADFTVLKQTVTNNTLTLQVQVNNLSGHKTPTSYPSRRAYLHLKVTDNATNDLIFESGKTNSNGSIEGNDADTSTNQFEPHYTTITSSDQVQIYESIMEDTAGQLTHTLLRAKTYKKDNRLLPKGFDKTTAAAEIAVLGAATSDTDFIAGSDTITYQIDLSSSNATELKLQIDLNYQPLSYQFKQDLYQDIELIEVKRLKRYLDTSTIVFETIATTNLTITR